MGWAWVITADLRASSAGLLGSFAKYAPTGAELLPAGDRQGGLSLSTPIFEAGKDRQPMSKQAQSAGPDQIEKRKDIASDPRVLSGIDEGPTLQR